MKLGMPTLIEMDTLEDNISLCKELGLDFLEINLDIPQYQNLQADFLKKMMSKHNIEFTFHLSEDCDIGHLNDLYRQAYIDSVKDIIELMIDINSRKINMHMSKGTYFSMPNEKIFLYKKYKKKYLQNISDFIRKIESMITNSSISFNIENTGDYDKDYICEAVDLILESKGFGLTWDVGHDYSSFGNDTEYLSMHEDKINHMHLHDAIDYKNHLQLYTGEINIKKCLSVAENNDCYVVIEVKSKDDLIKSVKKLRSEMKYKER